MGLDKPQTKTIEDHVWVVTQFPGRPANKYKMRLLKMVGPAISELLPAIGSLGELATGKAGSDKEKTSDKAKAEKAKADKAQEAAMVAAIPRVVASLAQHVDEDVFVDTQVELMSMSTRDGQTVTPELFDIEFAGNDLELYQALWFILQVNYPDFLGWVGKRLTGLHPTESPAETQLP